MAVDRNRKYAIRYFVQEWNKPVPKDFVGEEVIDGVTMSKSDFGYTDQLVIISIIDDEESKSFLICDSKEQGPPSRETLIAIREAINHQLEHHT